MRTCDEILELMSAALDGELTDSEQAELEEHLSHCSACSALFADLRELHQAAADLEDIPAPDGFAQGVMDRIAAHPAQERPDSNVVPFPARAARSHWKRWAASAAVVAVVALGAALLPGQWGGFSANSGADAGAPSLAQSAGAGTAASDDALTGDAQSPTERDVNTDQNSASAAMPESEELGDSSESTMNEDTNSAGSSKENCVMFATGSSPVYCGTLLLTGEPLPQGLEEYESSTDEQGNACYVVPADFYFSAAEALEAAQASNYADISEPDNTDPTAEYGLIIVEAS